MFHPTSDQVREFFCHVYQQMMPSDLNWKPSQVEYIAQYWITAHPEYHHYLQNIELAKHLDFQVENGQTNPFLHLSMHLAISEQIASDQPKGILALHQKLQQQGKDEHDIAHLMMEALGQVMWENQRKIDVNHKDSISSMEQINDQYLHYLHLETQK